MKYMIWDMKQGTAFIEENHFFFYFFYIFALHNRNGDLATIETMLVWLAQVLLSQNGEQELIETISGNFNWNISSSVKAHQLFLT